MQGYRQHCFFFLAYPAKFEHSKRTAQSASYMDGIPEDVFLSLQNQYHMNNEMKLLLEFCQ